MGRHARLSKCVFQEPPKWPVIKYGPQQAQGSPDNVPDKKATFSFRMGKTSIAFISSFRRNPEKQNKRGIKVRDHAITTQN